MSLERLEYDREGWTVSYTSDKADDPKAGRHTFEAVEFIARPVTHIPDKDHVIQRCYGYYANRMRGERRKSEEAGSKPTDRGRASVDSELPEGGVIIVEPDAFSRAEPRRRGC